jgi:hypothetical protein
MSIAPAMVERKHRLFPLHLNPFEFYMDVDDRPAYPMSFVVQMSFSGRLEPKRLTVALEHALERHPLLSAVVRPAKRGIECWVTDPDIAVKIRWHSFAETSELNCNEFLDLRCESGFRVWVQHDDSRAVITAQFHHATCDGIGAYQFLGDWLHRYAAMSGDEGLQPQQELLHSVLRDRFRQSLDLGKFLDKDGQVRIEWVEYQQMEDCGAIPLCPPLPAEGRVAPQTPVLRAPVPRAPARTEDPYDIGEHFPGFVTATLSRQEFRELRLRAQDKGLTPNDWSVVQYFRTMRDWNRDNWSDVQPGEPETSGSLSVLVPMSLREPGKPALSACNVVTYSVVNRAHEDLDDVEFLDGVRREMAQVKRERRDSPFLNMISGARVHEEMLDNLLRDDLCLATGTLSNTGDPTKQFLSRLPDEGGRICCGGLRLESIGGTPPLRPNTRVAVSLFTYKRELTICMRCDPNYFSVATSRELLERYRANLEM